MKVHKVLYAIFLLEKSPGCPDNQINGSNKENPIIPINRCGHKTTTAVAKIIGEKIGLAQIIRTKNEGEGLVNIFPNLYGEQHGWKNIIMHNNNQVVANTGDIINQPGVTKGKMVRRLHYAGTLEHAHQILHRCLCFSLVI